MKFFVSILSLALVPYAFASPIAVDSTDSYQRVDGFEILGNEKDILARQSTSTTVNEFTNGGCKSYVLLYARGTSQVGNLGAQPGLQLYNQIRAALGASNVAVQGVNYAAKVASNYLTGGCDPDDAANLANLITRVADACPSAKIFVSGYSQGAALVHASIKLTSATVKNRINAAVTFGDTQKQQDGGQISGFPAAKTLILCNTGDLVCDGTLTVTNAHLNYISSVPTAVSFFKSKSG